MDIFDLKNCVARGIHLQEIADFLMRREDEVLAKITELELPHPRDNGRERDRR